MSRRQPAACVKTGSSASQRLGGAEAAVIIVIIIVAGVAMVVGLPLTVILQLLAGAGLVAVVTVLLITSGLGKVLRPVLKALLA